MRMGLMITSQPLVSRSETGKLDRVLLLASLGPVELSPENVAKMLTAAVKTTNGKPRGGGCPDRLYFLMVRRVIIVLYLLAVKRYPVKIGYS